MPSLIGNKPNQVPTNGDLGRLAFMDNLDSFTSKTVMDTDITNIAPSLNLDFANSKVLDPRITFTRASTATFYNGISSAKAEENLFQFSQDFDNTYWTKVSATVTGNSTTAPDGTTTADSLVSTATATGVTVFSPTTAITPTAGQPFVITVYAKANTASYLQVLPNAGFVGSAFANFDLATGVVGTFGGSGLTTSITSVGSGWYRCNVIIASAVGTASYVQFFMVDSASAARGANYSGTIGNSLYLWGAQAEQRSAVTAYTPTTTAAVTNYIPTLSTAANGVARFDHNPITGESLGLLIEEQRANLFLTSNSIGGANWSNNSSQVTITTGAAIAPDGTQNASRFQEQTGQYYPFVYQNVTGLTNGASYTQSYYVKSAGRQWVFMSTYSIGGGYASGAYFDVINGIIGTVSSGITATIASVGNGWFRVTASGVLSAGTTYIYAGLNPTSNNGINPITAGYIGNGWNGILVWGAQLEAGSFATSYIPTVASQVTRSADAASMTGTNFSSWYNQNQGTFYCAANLSPTALIYSGFFNLVGTGSALNAQSVGSNNVSWLPPGSQTFGANQNFAANYTVTSSALSVSGASPLTSSTIGVGSANYTSMVIGASTFTRYLNGHIKKIAYYPRALTSAELVEMTA